MAAISKRRTLLFWKRTSEPRTQASLFHYIKEEPEPSIWTELDFSVLKHPLRFLMEEWRAPRTRPSLFHYIEDQKEEQGFRGVLGYCQAAMRSAWEKAGGYPTEFDQIAQSDVTFVERLRNKGRTLPLGRVCQGFDLRLSASFFHTLGAFRSKRGGRRSRRSAGREKEGAVDFASRPPRTGCDRDSAGLRTWYAFAPAGEHSLREPPFYLSLRRDGPRWRGRWRRRKGRKNAPVPGKNAANDASSADTAGSRGTQTARAGRGSDLAQRQRRDADRHTPG